MNNKKGKKNSKISIIFSFIGLVLIVVGIIIFFNKESVDKHDDKQDDNVIIHNMKDGEIDANNKLIQEYYKVFNYTYYKDEELLDTIKDSEVNQYVLISRLIKEEETTDVFCCEIDNSIVTKEESSCGGVYLKENWKNDTKAETKTIKKETLDNYYKYYFGKDKKTNIGMFNYKSFVFQNMLIYDSKSDSYVKIEIGEPSSGAIYMELLEKVEKKGDDLIFTSKLIPEDYNEGYNAIVTLTLTWEESTNHYIFKDRTVVKQNN